MLPHELAHSRDVPGVQRQDLDGVSFEEPPECVLRFRREVEQVHGFRNHGPDGDERLPDSFERVPARGVMAVVRVDEGHERPRVDEDQERFRLRSRRSFRNRSPVRSERSGGPPRTDPMTPRKASWGGLGVRDRGPLRAANLTASRMISDFVDPRSRARFSRSLSVSASIRTLVVIPISVIHSVLQDAGERPTFFSRA
jgi:hypothetical protein